MSAWRERIVRSRVTLAAVFAAALAVAPSARAQGLVFTLPWLGPASYSFTDTTLATYRQDNFNSNLFDDRVLAFTERFDSALIAAPWRFAVRIDAFLPILTTQLPSTSQPFLATSTPGGMPTQYTSCTLPYCTDYLRPDARIERIALRYQRGPLTAEIGDYYYFVIGRGLALAFRKIDPLGVDTTLRGGRFEFDAHRATVRGFGGYANPQNLDPITLTVNYDWGGPIAQGASAQRPGPDIIGGGEAAVRFGPDEDVELGVHALRLHAPSSAASAYDVDVVGYRAQAPALFDGQLALHLEVDALRRTTTTTHTGGPGMMGVMQTNVTEDYGRAVFGAAQFRLGNLNGLFEWKDYTNYLVSPDGGATDINRIYSAAPSLERDDVTIRSNSQTRGGRLRLEYALRPSPWTVSVTGLVAGSSVFAGTDPWGPDGYGQAHAYVIVRRRARTIAQPIATTRPIEGATPVNAAGGIAGAFSAATGAIGTAGRVSEWGVTASTGVRYEWTLGAPNVVGNVLATETSSHDDWITWHADMDLAFPIGPHDSIEVRIDGRIERRYYPQVPQCSGGCNVYYTRDGISATWAHGDRLQISGVYRYDTLLQAEGLQLYSVDGTTHLVSASPYPVNYPAAEIRYMFYPGSTIRFFMGATPGGRLCTGGVCRDVPPFEGGILELVLRI